MNWKLVCTSGGVNVGEAPAVNGAVYHQCFLSTVHRSPSQSSAASMRQLTANNWLNTSGSSASAISMLGPVHQTASDGYLFIQVMPALSRSSLSIESELCHLDFLTHNRIPQAVRPHLPSPIEPAAPAWSPPVESSSHPGCIFSPE